MKLSPVLGAPPASMPLLASMKPPRIVFTKMNPGTFQPSSTPGTYFTTFAWMPRLTPATSRTSLTGPNPTPPSASEPRLSVGYHSP